jgi:hypothetical protein
LVLIYEIDGNEQSELRAADWALTDREGEKMGAGMNSYSVLARAGNSSHLSGVLRTAPLVMATVIFTLISFRYLAHPVRAAAEAGIAFTSPGGITIARVGFAGFPLSLAILAFASHISARWRLTGLYMVLTVDSVVMVVRIVGFWLDHSSASAPLLAPEAVLLTLSIIAIRLESTALPRTGAPGDCELGGL